MEKQNENEMDYKDVKGLGSPRWLVAGKEEMETNVQDTLCRSGFRI